MKSKSLAIKRTGFFHHYSPQQQARILVGKLNCSRQKALSVFGSRPHRDIT
jgi:hypothetical protein